MSEFWLVVNTSESCMAFNPYSVNLLAIVDRKGYESDNNLVGLNKETDTLYNEVQSKETDNDKLSTKVLIIEFDHSTYNVLGYNCELYELFDKINTIQNRGDLDKFLDKINHDKKDKVET